jgi:2-phospho-L-lactate guanylyltransferase
VLVGGAGRAYDEPVPYRGGVEASTGWTAVVPLKETPEAKQRLRVPSGLRTALALAFAADTVTALLESRHVHEVVVVGGRGLAPALLASPALHRVADVRGLNAAVEAGVRVARQRSGRGVLVLHADLPCLRAGEVDALLEQASPDAASALADADGDGTTALLLPPGVTLPPTFGPGSHARHLAAGARPVTGELASVRRDVDTVEHLETARLLGVGPHTAAVLDSVSGVSAR